MEGVDAFLMRAMSTAIEIAMRLHSVANDLATAMLALRRQGVNRAFETIEKMRTASGHDLKRLVIFIPANFTLVHTSFQLLNTGRRRIRVRLVPYTPAPQTAGDRTLPSCSLNNAPSHTL